MSRVNSFDKISLNNFQVLSKNSLSNLIRTLVAQKRLSGINMNSRTANSKISSVQRIQGDFYECQG
jgi:hypothetical protein